MTHWLNGNRQPAFIIITTVGDPYLEVRGGGALIQTLRQWRGLLWRNFSIPCGPWFGPKKSEGGPPLAKNKASERARKNKGRLGKRTGVGSERILLKMNTKGSFANSCNLLSHWLALKL